MSWQMAVVGAIGAAQYQQQGAIGKYNQAVSDRNAVVAEQEAALIEKQSEFDIARFDKDFRKFRDLGLTGYSLKILGSINITRLASKSFLHIGSTL